MITGKPDVFEMFCGPGGQGLGFSPFFNVSYAFDISTPAVKTYQANHPETQVRQQDVRDLPEPGPTSTVLLESLEVPPVNSGPVEIFTRNRTTPEPNSPGNIYAW